MRVRESGNLPTHVADMITGHHTRRPEANPGKLEVLKDLGGDL